MGMPLSNMWSGERSHLKMPRLCPALAGFLTRHQGCHAEFPFQAFILGLWGKIRHFLWWCCTPADSHSDAGCTPLMSTAIHTFPSSFSCTVSLSWYSPNNVTLPASVLCLRCYAGPATFTYKILHRQSIITCVQPLCGSQGAATPCPDMVPVPCAVLQFVLSPVLLWRSFVSMVLANVLYMVALSYYHYLSFLGYSALPFLEHTEVFLWPVAAIVLVVPFAVLAGFNPSRFTLNIYFG